MVFWVGVSVINNRHITLCQRHNPLVGLLFVPIPMVHPRWLLWQIGFRVVFSRFLDHFRYAILMKEMPAVVTHIIEDHLAVLLLWCSQYLYERLLPHWQGDYLVQTAAHFDFTPIEQACAAYHQGPSQRRGRPVSHTVGKMVRVLFLMYQEGNHSLPLND